MSKRSSEDNLNLQLEYAIKNNDTETVRYLIKEKGAVVTAKMLSAIPRGSSLRGVLEEGMTTMILDSATKQMTNVYQTVPNHSPDKILDDSSSSLDDSLSPLTEKKEEKKNYPGSSPERVDGTKANNNSRKCCIIS